jgi:uncharacterized protein YdcH (DUF465 family)
MEKVDQELLNQLAPHHARLKKLYDEHRKLEKQLVNLSRFSTYSPSTALKQQQLKKQKLRGMDTIMRILSEYRT